MSSSDRTFAAIRATTRSRSSASANADVERAAVERWSGLAGNRLQERELIALEGPRLGHRPCDEDGDHLLVGDERDKGEALRAGRLHQPGAHDLRCGRVVDGERRCVERRRRDARRLVLEIDAEAGEPRQLSAVDPSDDSRSRSAVLVDEEEAARLDVDELLDLPEQAVGEGRRIVHGSNSPDDGLGLGLVTLKRRACRTQEGTRTRERQNRRNADEDRHGEAQPDMTAERLPVHDDHKPVCQCDRADDGKQQERREIRESRLPALRPQPPAEDDRSSEVGHGDEKQRHRVEPQSLVGL